jgi:hypothetical protein
MAMDKTDNQYEVLSPWAEADPIPLKGLASRLKDLSGTKIGLFVNSKRASRSINDAVAVKLKDRFRSLDCSFFTRNRNVSVAETEDNEKFVEWIKGLDGVILSVGD